MAALTKEQWFLKLKSWVPAWVFEKEQTNVALFKGIAAVLAKLQEEGSNSVAQTFIDKALSPYLDLHGDERGVKRLAGELNAPYRIRIKSNSLVFQGSPPYLVRLVNAILIRGITSIKEDWEGGLYVGFSYLNRGEVLINPIENAFTIVVDRQVHAPFSFVSREYYEGDSYVGQGESNNQIFELIVEAVNEAKAFGTLYRVIERLN